MYKHDEIIGKVGLSFIVDLVNKTLYKLCLCSIDCEIISISVRNILPFLTHNKGFKCLTPRLFIKEDQLYYPNEV